MSLPKPNLDDKTFDRLLEEGRGLIPRYAPLWTDHNESDPGITLIELLAWLTEAMLYRLNRIEDRHKLKYLRLLGASPVAGKAAKTDLTFESAANVTLTKGQKVWTTTAGQDLCFELDEEIHVRPVTLKRVIVDEMTGVFDRTALNEQGDQFYPAFGLTVQKGAALYLAFDRGPDTVTFFCYLYETDLIEAGSHGREADYAFSNAKLRWEITSPGGWKSIAPKLDGTESFKKSGSLVFDNIEDWTAATIPMWTDPKGAAWHWLRCVVEESEFEYPPRIHTLKMNTVSATHGQTIEGDEIRVSDGSPWQTVKLSRSPVLAQSLILSVDGTPWRESPDFDGSGLDDCHFVLDCEKGEVTFGDGLLGKVPPEGSVVRVEKYRVGGGEEGNIKAGRQWILPGHDEVVVANHIDAQGGEKGETIEEATLRFLKDLKVPYPAVTSSDFEYIARNTPGARIAKAKAIPNYDPDMGPRKGTVTVAVIPYTPLDFLEKPPAPSKGLLKAICRHLDEHRLLGTEIRVVGALYIKVQVTLQVTSTGDVPDEALGATIVESLNKFIHPVKGWTDGKGWPLGRAVYRSEIYELLEKIEGVDCLFNLILWSDRGTAMDDEGNLIPASRIATVYSGTHSVTVIARRDECSKER